MKEDFIKQIIDSLEKELHTKKSNDFIGDIFEQRVEDIYAAMMNNKKYKKHMDKVNELNIEIQNKFADAWKMIEKYEEIAYDRSVVGEKLMYKYGLLDGILFILEGTKKIDITKYLSDNN